MKKAGKYWPSLNASEDGAVTPDLWMNMQRETGWYRCFARSNPKSAGSKSSNLLAK